MKIPSIVSLGNNWGTDSDGSSVGHGPQEQFYGCADIAISESNNGGSGHNNDSDVAHTSTMTTPEPTTRETTTDDIQNDEERGNTAVVQNDEETTTVGANVGTTCRSAGAYEGEGAITVRPT